MLYKDLPIDDAKSLGLILFTTGYNQD